MILKGTFLHTPALGELEIRWWDCTTPCPRNMRDSR